MHGIMWKLEEEDARSQQAAPWAMGNVETEGRGEAADGRRLKSKWKAVPTSRMSR